MPMFKATATAYRDGAAVHSFSVENADERFAAFKAVEEVQKHGQGQYWQRIAVEIQVNEF